MPDHSGDITPQPYAFDLRSHDVAEVSRGFGDCMPGLDVRSMTKEQRLASGVGNVWAHLAAPWLATPEDQC
ncbi:MAG TPA: hypothetical protein VIP09_01030 [Dehalococcoidia bacterium]|jgi:hypothetical protein